MTTTTRPARIVMRRADLADAPRKMDPKNPTAHQLLDPTRKYASPTEVVYLIRRDKGGKVVALRSSGLFGVEMRSRVTLHHDTGTGGADLGWGTVVGIWEASTPRAWRTVSWKNADGTIGNPTARRCDLYFAI